jgi:hypothetical protein
MTKRIEFTERFFHVTEEAMEKADSMNIPPEGEYKYRRVNVPLYDIFAPKEIPGKKSHCMIEFYDGTSIIVKGSYDSVCQLIDDREAQFDEIDEGHQE